MNTILYPHIVKEIFKKYLIFALLLWILPYLLGKYADISYNYIAKVNIMNELILPRNWNMDKNYCALPKFEDSSCYRDYKELLDSFKSNSSYQYFEGFWKPLFCKSLFKVNIIVPYRERKMHLNIFLNYMYIFLQKQKIEYRIIIVEQIAGKEFNRALLFNIGFLEVSKLSDLDQDQCFIFHDVDLLPLCLGNIYTCTRYPRHMSSSVDVFRFQLPYRQLFGGVTALTCKDIKKINGFPNSYFGWGGEDDDISARLDENNLLLSRFDPSISKYTMLDHRKALPSSQRLKILRQHNREDGLYNLNYTLINTNYYKYFIQFTVEF